MYIFDIFWPVDNKLFKCSQVSFIGLGLPIITNLCFKSLIWGYIDLVHIKLYDINLSSKFASFLEYKMAKYLRPGFWEHCCCCSRLLRQSCQHHSHCRLWLVGTCILIEPFHCVHLHKWDIIFSESSLQCENDLCYISFQSWPTTIGLL